MDGTVNGTSGNDFIEETYVDPDGDQLNNTDDIVDAGDGDDVVYTRNGDDTVYGGGGNDVIRGENDDDLLYGGTGNDWVKGDDGNDTIVGDEGDDTLWGGADRDLLIAGKGDIVDGGSTGDDYDALDLRGIGPYRLVNVVPDSNGNGYNGTVELLDAHGKPTGETIQFFEIETFLKDPPKPMGDGTVEGTGGDDVIDVSYTGDPEGDRIDNNDALLPGYTGNDDLVYAFGGNDTVYAEDGDDEVYGGAGNDTLYGGEGDDTLYGNTGDDVVYGGEGDDYVQDSLGHETIYGGKGDDTVKLSGPQGDTIYGGTGRDTIYGGDGDDVIDSSDGGIGLFDNPYPPLPTDPDPFNDRDSVDGGRGDDVIRTGDDRDTIKGGDGNDTINAGIDDDSVEGNRGDDTIIGNEGNDTIHGNAGNDVIYGGLDPIFPDSLNIPDDQGDLVPDNGLDLIYGGAGDDTVYGEDDDDTIYGGGGDDRLDGGVDDDEVHGDSGNDVITGGQGNDALFGGNDRDVFLGGNGGDHVDGGAGGDDFDVLDLTGSGVDFITYTSADREDGIVTFLDGSTMTFEEIENVIPCFTPGTTIATPRGERLVEELKEGDRIITRDNGIQEIRWVGQKVMSGRALVSSPHLKPVLVRAGSLGNGLPERDMLVSPNHRLLVGNDRTQLYFEESEVLVAAKHLVGMAGVHVVDALSTTYIHFMFDRHEVVLSNGAWTESFQPGDYTLKGIGNAQRTEILELFPELKTRAGVEAYQAARKSLKKHEAKLLVK